jgi:tetratricopeptide (TPR) repeat protein
MDTQLTAFSLLTIMATSLLLARLFAIIIHVLGHGITALLTTKSTVSLYIGEILGSYCLIKMPLHPRLVVYFTYFPLDWLRGSYFLSNTPVDTRRWIIVAFAGPIASLLLAITAGYIMMTDSYFILIKIISGLILFFAFIDFLSLIPRKKKHYVFNTPFYNDGATIQQLFKNKSVADALQHAKQLYLQQEYAQAISVLQQQLDKGSNNKIIYQYLLNCYLFLNDTPNVLKTAKILEEQFDLPEENYNSIGLYYAAAMESHEEALRYFEKAIALQPEYIDAISNKAFVFMCMGQNEPAIEFFNQVLALEPASAYAYSNRGLAKMKSGNLDDGLKDIQTALDLDQKEAYAHRNMGIYHLEMNNHQEALKNFEQAYALNPNVYQIKMLIEKAQKVL